MAPGGLVEVCVSWSEHPRYLKKKKKREGKRETHWVWGRKDGYDKEVRVSELASE